MEKLPVYRLDISEDLEAKEEVNAVALVDVPAIGEGFFAFNKHLSFAVADEEQRIVVGPAMIPDLPIYRRDEAGEYYVVFNKKTIEKIALKFYAKGLQQSANEMHTTAVDGVTFFQSWIADESKGIPKMKQFEDLPDGTWFLGAKVDNEETWAKVKDGTFKGFSVEGYFDMIPVQLRANESREERVLNELKELLKNI